MKGSKSNRFLNGQFHINESVGIEIAAFVVIKSRGLAQSICRKSNVDGGLLQDSVSGRLNVVVDDGTEGLQLTLQL